MVKRAFHANRNNNAVETLAGIFGVSRQAMKIRLEELNLLY
jgi:Zn-dependent peptidase ImmA (M78 family)